MKSSIAVLACLLSSASPLLARPHDHANMDKLGTVSFGTSCSTAVQPRFDKAVALMHSFQFGRAIQGFNEILGADPECGIAYWGIALSSWSNPFAGFKSPAQLAAGLAAVQQARAVGAKTARERGYIEAVAKLYTDSAGTSQPARMLAYEEAMASVSAANPDDAEATIFYALALAAAADPTDKSYAKQRKAGALLERLFARYPDHPGLAHYIIHAYDEPALASRAAEAARRYGAIAPSTPHALHMPSHTYTRLGDWQASIDTNLASAAAAQAAGQPADILHASDYLIYAYLQTGQDKAAGELVKTSIETFRQFDPARATGAAPPSAAYYANAAIPARYCLERRDWSGAARLELVPSPFPNADAITYFAHGLGAAYLRDGVAAAAAMASLDRMREKLIATHDAYWAGQIDIARREIAARLAYAQGDAQQAVAGLRAAAALEDKTELASVTPGSFLPAREMLGELLLELNRPHEALVEFRASLAGQPNRFWSLLGAVRAARLSGDRQAARGFARTLVRITEHADLSRRPAMVEIRTLAH
jgi:hypothetical protein